MIPGEWILEETFRRKLRPIEVTLGYARAADVQLSKSARHNRLTILA
jgi:hypothetical protein